VVTDAEYKRLQILQHYQQLSFEKLEIALGMASLLKKEVMLFLYTVSQDII
jgi:hypothetical protein